jgi:hypothetical protein
MELLVLTGLAVLLILFVWGWIAVVMVHHLSIERRIEKLVNITNPLPEEEKELSSLKEQRMIETGKVASAKWTLVFFMLMIIGSMVALVYYPSLRALLGLDTALQAIWIGVVVLAFFCMPTFLGLVLAGSSTRLPKELRKDDGKAEEGAA